MKSILKKLMKINIIVLSYILTFALKIKVNNTLKK